MPPMPAASEPDYKQRTLRGFFKQFSIPKIPPTADRVKRQAPDKHNPHEFHFAIFRKRIDAIYKEHVNLPAHPQSRAIQQDDTLHLSITHERLSLKESIPTLVDATMVVAGQDSPAESAVRRLPNSQSTSQNATISKYFRKTPSASPSPVSEQPRRSLTPASTASNGSLKRKLASSAVGTPTPRSKSPRTTTDLQSAQSMADTRTTSPNCSGRTLTDQQPSSSALSDLPSKSPSLAADPPSGTQQSLPMSSAQSRSKAIRSSQSDEDEEDAYVPDACVGEGGSDSDSSDEDLNTYFARRRKAADALPTIIKQEEHTPITSNTRLRSSRSTNRQSTARASLTITGRVGKRNTYKNSLMKLAEQAKRDSNAQAEFDKVYAEITAPDQVDSHGSTTNTAATPSEELLATVVKDSEDGENQVDRMLQAMSRIDAFQTDTLWHFFKGSSDDPYETTRSFPSISDKESQVAALKRRSFRDQAFISGFAADLINDLNISQKVSLDILCWVWHSYFTEPREDLAHGYLHCMKSCYSYWNHSIDVKDINDLLMSFGAFDESIAFDQDLLPNQRLDSSLSRPSPGLIIRILDAFKNLRANLTADAKVHALGIMLRLGIDRSIMQTANVQICLRESLTAVADLISSDHKDGTVRLLKDDPFHAQRLPFLITQFHLLASDLYTHLTNPILQCRLVDSIPSSSPRLHLLRRRLALAFFLDDSNMLLQSLEHPLRQYALYPTSKTPGQDQELHINTQVMTLLHESPRFDTTDVQLDYNTLGAYISMLDVAIDCGFPFSYRNQETRPKTTKAPSDESESTKVRDKDVEAAFNRSVDAMVAEVDGLWSRISDTGASHMARTDAKNVLERLKRRLEYGVRTKVRRRKSVFEGGGKNFGRASLTAATDHRLNGFEDQGFGEVQRKFMDNIFIKPVLKDHSQVS